MLWLSIGFVLQGFFVLKDICYSCKRSTKEMECGERVKGPALFVGVTGHTGKVTGHTGKVTGHTGKVTSQDKLITEMSEA
jgi:hypothetical protein